jgi:hypothetical protein
LSFANETDICVVDSDSDVITVDESADDATDERREDDARAVDDDDDGIGFPTCGLLKSVSIITAGATVAADLDGEVC